MIANGFIRGQNKLSTAFHKSLISISAELKGIYHDLERRELRITPRRNQRSIPVS
ncbi:MAG: hypothetical protein ACNS62_15945 [Candidatus Cyclobacteriaceae bacterium M3_2C_046]